MDETHLAGIAQDVASLFPATAARRLAVEYGGGLGALTESLLREDLTVHCVERDRDLVPLLKNHFARPLQENRLWVHEADAARYSLPFDAQEGVVCGNLPYHLTSTLLLKTCDEVSNCTVPSFWCKRKSPSGSWPFQERKIIQPCRFGFNPYSTPPSPVTCRRVAFRRPLKLSLRSWFCDVKNRPCWCPSFFRT